MNLFFLLLHKPGLLEGWFCSVWAGCKVPVLHPCELEAALESLTELPSLLDPLAGAAGARLAKEDDAGVVGRAVWEVEWGFPGWFLRDV